MRIYKIAQESTGKARIQRAKHYLEILETQGQKQLWFALDKIVENCGWNIKTISGENYETILLNFFGGLDKLDPKLKRGVEFAIEEHKYGRW